MPKIQYLHKTRQGIPGIYAQKFGDILQNMNFSRYYRNRGKFIYGFDPNIIFRRYIIMKNRKEQKWKQATVSLVRKIATREANMVCSFLSYQRKLPDSVKKLRKF